MSFVAVLEMLTMLDRDFTLKRYSIIIDLFKPLGEPISLHLLWCDPMTEEYRNFKGCSLTIKSGGGGLASMCD
jgi:hypothetical protein